MFLNLTSVGLHCINEITVNHDDDDDDNSKADYSGMSHRRLRNWDSRFDSCSGRGSVSAFYLLCCPVYIRSFSTVCSPYKESCRMFKYK
jgi:hypothetical protein